MIMPLESMCDITNQSLRSEDLAIWARWKFARKVYVQIPVEIKARRSNLSR